MIISHKHGFIFAAIPKTGTHAVRRALREHMGPEDHEQVGLFVHKAFPDPALAAVRHGHLSLDQVRDFIGAENFARYLKFAFVRNPFDRFVSYCAFVTRDTGEFERRPQELMRHILDNPPNQHILFQPQCTFVTDTAGKVLADELGRVEDMQASYDRITAKLSLPTASLERVNTSRRDDYRSYYNDALIEGVRRLYARDLDLFGYAF